MNTKDSIILIEDESSCESFCSNCKELIANQKRKRMEKELKAMRINTYISNSNEMYNDNDSENDNESVESYSAKRSRWYL